MTQPSFEYRVGIVGCPSHPRVEWSRGNLERLRELGFNTLQLNIAWATRPADEPLNLEDVVSLPEELHDRLAGSTPLLSDPSPERRHQRREDLHHRIALCREMGFRSVFHFGAPYIGDRFIGDAPPHCLLDGRTEERCVVLLKRLATEFPGIDDILIYTYDQHAWLCSEFGPCPRCTGIPLHERVVPFLERMAVAWRETSPSGRLWWEPWELSAGQVYRCLDAMDPETMGLSLHSNIAEVMATHPVDRWLRNTCALAAKRDLPVLVEHWLGSSSEEVEPCMHLAYPLLTLRGLKAIAGIPRLTGIKEYYGLVPDREDPNLRMTALFLSNPAIGEDEALRALAQPYGSVASEIVTFWWLSSEALELFPWDLSWLLRRLGAKDPKHSLDAAHMPGVPWHTPSWQSTRHSIYMRVEHSEMDPWMLEDIQIRCEFAAERMTQALVLGIRIVDRVPEPLRRTFALNLEELDTIRRVTLGMAYHYRETNIAKTMRVCRDAGREVPDRLVREMESLLQEDQANQRCAEPVATALADLEQDLDSFLDTYFLREGQAAR